ncbi:MAG: sigma-70 family RNA polymerase sigma factor [Bacteroidota bacterium]|nr:sigma-70 family RNA polymerase sigma factor [Bacteroidota bacterium]
MTPAQPPHMIVGGFNRREDWAITLIWKYNDVFVSKLVSRFLGQTPFNQDTVADIFGILNEHTGHFKSLNDITRFLNSTTINICRDELKKRQTQEKHEAGLIYHYRSMEEDDIEIAEAVARQQMLVRLQIARIPGKSGQIFRMQFVQYLTHTEIAQRLGISEKTVRNHLSAAVRFLKMGFADGRRRYAYALVILLLIYLYENF